MKKKKKMRIMNKLGGINDSDMIDAKRAVKGEIFMALRYRNGFTLREFRTNLELSEIRFTHNFLIRRILTFRVH